MSFPGYAEYKQSGVGWLDLVPVHWAKIPLKYVALDPGSLFLDGDWIESKDITGGAIRYITTGNVGEGKYKDQGNSYINEGVFASLSCTEVFPGDILVSRLNNPIGRACIIPDLGARIVTSVDNVIFRPDRGFEKKYLVFLLSSEEYFKHTSDLARGTTMQRISRSLLGNIRIPVPPFHEQKKIAAFLDHETAKIDALIAEQQRLIELLKEKRQAVISHAVTKGLNPNAPMKDSGVEWLGEVPAHWKVVAIKWITPVLRGASPRPIDDPVYFEDEGEYAWVRIADVSASDGILSETTQRLSNLGASLSVKLEPGEMFLSIAGTVGKPCITNIKACIHDGFVFFPELKMPNKYLYRIFEAGLCYGGLGKMGTQLNLNTDTVGGIKIALPGEDEIDEVLAVLDRQLVNIDELIEQAKDTSQLLKERRAALISAAVTGKIDVRGWQPSETACPEPVLKAAEEAASYG